MGSRAPHRRDYPNEEGAAWASAHRTEELQVTEEQSHAHKTSCSTGCCYWKFQVWQSKMFDMSAASSGNRTFQKWENRRGVHNQTQDDLRVLRHRVPSLLRHRFYQHRSNIDTNTGAHVTRQFNLQNHTLANMKCLAIEKVHTDEMMMIIIIIIIIIIAFKGAIRDFFTISSLRRELNKPGRNRVQPKCNTLSAYHVQDVLRATWYEGTAQLLSLTEFKSKPLNRWRRGRNRRWHGETPGEGVFLDSEDEDVVSSWA